MDEELKARVIAFLENAEQFLGQTVVIQEALSSNALNFDRHFTSFARLEFVLNGVSARISGGRATLRGETLFYEIWVDSLVNFTAQVNEFEFLEKYSETVYRQSKLKFIKSNISQP